MTRLILGTVLIGLFTMFSFVSYSQDTLSNKKPTELSFAEAIDKGMLDFKISGSYDPRIFREILDLNGVHYGKCMAIVMGSKIDSLVLLRLDCGTQLIPSDTSFQTMIATQEAIFPLYPNKIYTTRFYAMCGQLHDASPDIGTTFSIGELADTGLVKLANYLGDNYIQNKPGQHALWAYTDQADFAELKKYGADSLSIAITKEILYTVGLETELTPRLVASIEDSNQISINRYFIYAGIVLLSVLLTFIIILIIKRTKNDTPIA
jgi:hypothetical protein